MTDEAPAENPVVVNGQPIVWAMDRIGAWVEAGCDPTDSINMDARTLKLLEAEGYVKVNLDPVGKKSVPAVLTALGKYEMQRLAHLVANDAL